MDTVLVGAFKVKDGLFIGDEFAAQDLEFVVANKVTRIVNCASRQVPNHWEPIGVRYLSFAWFDSDKQIILDSSDKNFTSIFSFIEQGLDTGESVLVHSVRGLSRCVCVIAAYLIKKYNWSLYKSLDFVAFRRPDLDLNPGFLSQLASFEGRVTKNSKVPRSDQWDLANDNPEEIVLRNTYLNARLGQSTDYHLACTDEDKPPVIKWNDKDRESLAHNKVENGVVTLKSCFKGHVKNELKFPVFNLKTIKEKETYSRFNFGKIGKEENAEVTKVRASSLNRKENQLIKDAINATRGLMDQDLPRTRFFDDKKVRKSDEFKGRPLTAPQKRPPSPKVIRSGKSLKGSVNARKSK